MAKEKISYRTDPVFCICGKERILCPNYIFYGYDCNGKRFDDGKVYRAPFGSPKSDKDLVGPDCSQLGRDPSPDVYCKQWRQDNAVQPWLGPAPKDF